MNTLQTLAITTVFAITSSLVTISNAQAAENAPPPLMPIPSPAQMAWAEDELTVFIHFGMNTFTGRSTGLGTEDPNLFNPTNFDPRQWAREAKECGFKALLLTAKHHDGFCLWPTKSTSHSIASSKWKDGKGDVVKEVADACKEYGLKFGIYCSPWDRSQKIYSMDKSSYAKLYHTQISELMSNYGPIYEMWFDGNKANVDEWPNIIKLVRTLQPNTVIKQGPKVIPIAEDVRWVGNEMACAPIDNWCVYPRPTEKEAPKSIWFPLECDTPMIGHWFWCNTLPLDLQYLLNFYYTSVGRNSIFLMNIAPNPKGVFCKNSVERLHEFSDALDKIFGTDFAAGKQATASNVRGANVTFGADKALDGRKNTYWTTDDGVTEAWLEVNLGEKKDFNVVRMEEMISLGQRVSSYKVEVWNEADKSWKAVNKGSTIGYRKLDRIPKVTSSKVRLTILTARACPLIKEFGVHLDSVSPPEHFESKFANGQAKRGTRMPRQCKLPGNKQKPL